MRRLDREADGTATWSLSGRCSGRCGERLMGCPDHRDAGLSWQRDRSWCDTGTVMRRRKGGPVNGPRRHSQKLEYLEGERLGLEVGPRTRRGPYPYPQLGARG